MIETPDLSTFADGPLIVNPQSYWKLWNEHAEMKAALEAVIAESDDPNMARLARRVLRRLGLRD